jgi:hypothetical protein
MMDSIYRRSWKGGVLVSSPVLPRLYRVPPSDLRVRRELRELVAVLLGKDL